MIEDAKFRRRHVGVAHQLLRENLARFDLSRGFGGAKDAQAVRLKRIDDAVRKGVRPDGSRLYPAMPYPAYTKMTRDDVLAYCNERPSAAETYPFGDGVAVFKIEGRMFAIVSLEGSPGDMTLKCDPELAIGADQLKAVFRAQFGEIGRQVLAHEERIDAFGRTSDEVIAFLFG